MKFEIKNNKIYRNGKEIIPCRNSSGKVVCGTSAQGLWFAAKTENHCFTVYKKDLIGLSKNAHDIFFKYTD